MVDPDNMLKVKMLGDGDHYLELDPESIIGWLSYKEGTAIYVKGSPDHSVFSTQNDVDSIKEQLRQLKINKNSHNNSEDCVSGKSND